MYRVRYEAEIVCVEEYDTNCSKLIISAGFSIR